MIDDRREAWRLVIGDRWIGGGQHHLAERFERDAVVPPVEPDQRLPVRRRPIGPGVDVDDLVDRILRGCLERRLDAAAGLDAVGTRSRVERHGISCVMALGETAHRHHGGRGRHPEERTSVHDQLRLARGRGGSHAWRPCGRYAAAIGMSSRAWRDDRGGPGILRLANCIDVRANNDGPRWVNDPSCQRADRDLRQCQTRRQEQGHDEAGDLPKSAAYHAFSSSDLRGSGFGAGRRYPQLCFNPVYPMRQGYSPVRVRYTVYWTPPCYLGRSPTSKQASEFRL